MKLRASAAAVWLMLGCSNTAAPVQQRSSALPDGQVARAGSELVSASSVSRIADAQGITPRAALSAAVSDALFAQGARDALPSSARSSIERAAAARTQLEQLGRDAARAGTPTDAEIADIVRERWADLDRPEAVRTSHVVVLNSKPERDAAARALAQKLAEVLQGVSTGDELIKKADTVPKEGFDVKAQKLPFVTPDGRTFQHREHDQGFVAGPADFDLDFARAANALHDVGQLSSVVKSSFGYHVILLEERAPQQQAPKAQLPTLLVEEVQTRRASRARHELLERLQQAEPVQLDRAFDELTAHVDVKAAP